MLYVIVFTVELGLGIIPPILPAIMEEFALSAWQAGLMVTVYGLARLITDVPLGFLLDRLNRAQVLAAGALLIVLGSAASIYAQSFEFLLVARLVMGVGTALCLVTALFQVSKGALSHSRGRSIGIYQATMLAGVTISPAIGGIAASIAGWRAAFLFGIIAGIAALVMIVVASKRGALHLSLPADHSEEAVVENELEPPARTIPWDIVAINFTTFVFFASTSGFRNSMVPVYGGTALGITAATLGLLLGGSAIVRFMVTLGSGFASDRWGRKVILIPGILFLAAGTLGFTLASDTTGFAICLGILSLGGFGNSVPTTMLVDVVAGRRVGMAISVNRAMGDLGMLIGPVALGLILDLAGFQLVAVVTAALLVTTLPGIVFGVKEGPWQARRFAKVPAVRT